MKVNKFSLLFIAGAVVVAAGLMAVQKKVVVPSGEAMQASAGGGHQGHAMPCWDNHSFSARQSGQVGVL